MTDQQETGDRRQGDAAAERIKAMAFFSGAAITTAGIAFMYWPAALVFLGAVIMADTLIVRRVSRGKGKTV